MAHLIQWTDPSRDDQAVRASLEAYQMTVHSLKRNDSGQFEAVVTVPVDHLLTWALRTMFGEFEFSLSEVETPPAESEPEDSPGAA